MPFRILACLFFSVPLMFAAPQAITVEPEAGHSVLAGKSATVVNIVSERGIGKATIRAAEGKWPEVLIIRLHLKGLENFEISNGPFSLQTWVGSSDAKAAPTSIAKTRPGGGKEAQEAIAQDHPLSLAVKIVPKEGGKPGIPLEGYFEITVPAGLLKSGPKSLEIAWVDFYRG